MEANNIERIQECTSSSLSVNTIKISINQLSELNMRISENFISGL